MTRALAIQRPQIAALKALGYTNREIGWHYVKWSLVIATVGAAIGIVGGRWLGAGFLWAAAAWTRPEGAALFVYGDDPAEIARRFKADGAEYLHVVDLDAARSGKPANTA